MRVVVLGAAAGGGFPQWNSNASACRRARGGDPAALPRTQAGLAVSADGDRWFLFNAAPDLREQISRNSVLHPKQGLRSSPIAGVVLTGGDVDVIAGLLTLRERQSFVLHATARILGVLDANPIFEVLDRAVVERRRQDLNASFALDDVLTVELFAVPGKTPLYLESGDPAPAILTDETTVGALISDGARKVFFIPGCAVMPPDLAERLQGADLVFFDGTLWRDDEMIAAGLGLKTGRRMGHMSLGGPDGVIEAFRAIKVGRKVALHINNSNPVLLADSPERAEAEAAGWTIAHDGLEIAL
jgi:pyrroloquinoline quinone biosynthesis protein B